MKKRPWITLRRGVEDGRKVITVHFYYNKEVLDQLKSLRVARYHAIGKYWYIEADRFDRRAFVESMRPVAGVNCRALAPGWRPPKGPRPMGLQSERPSGSTWGPLTPENDALVKRFHTWAGQQECHPLTSDSSRQWFADLIAWLQPDDLKTLSPFRFIEFVQDHILAGKLTTVEQKGVISIIIRFFHEELGHHLTTPYHITKIERSHIPRVAEVKSLFNAPIPLKQRCMFALVYLFGLPGRQVVKIVAPDLDPEKNSFIIRTSVKLPDRLTQLPEMLRQWLQQYRKEEVGYLFFFEGDEPGLPYPDERLSRDLYEAMKSLPLERPFTLTGLRKSYAVHLIEECRNVPVSRKPDLVAVGA